MECNEIKQCYASQHNVTEELILALSTDVMTYLLTYLLTDFNVSVVVRRMRKRDLSFLFQLSDERTWTSTVCLSYLLSQGNIVKFRGRASEISEPVYELSLGPNLSRPSGRLDKTWTCRLSSAGLKNPNYCRGSGRVPGGRPLIDTLPIQLHGLSRFLC